MSSSEYEIRPIEMRGGENKPEDLLRAMQVIRAVETALRDNYLEGKFEGPLHVSLGQEGAAVGVIAGMGKQDLLLSNHRGHGHALAFGLDPRRVIAEIVGSPEGYGAGRGGSMHIVAPRAGFLGTNGIVGDCAGLALGAALSIKRLGLQSTAVAIFGDGAMGEGLVYESFNMASLWKLPVVFVCENNGYAEMTSTELHLSSSPTKRAEAFGLNAFTARGVDITSVGDAIKKAIEGTKQAVPGFVEVKTYRWEGHYVGDHEAYRAKGEAESWREEHCPIRSFASRIGINETRLLSQQNSLLENANKMINEILAGSETRHVE